MRKSSLYKVLNIPPAYANSALNVSTTMYKKLESMCDTLPTNPVKIFVQGDIGGLVNMLVDKKGLNSVIGMDFKEIFADVFNKESANLVPFDKIVILYGVGEEQAVASTFPTQVLKGLLSTLEEHNCIVFLNTPLTYSRFLERYGISFVNTLKLPNKQEEKIC